MPTPSPFHSEILQKSFSRFINICISMSMSPYQFRYLSLSTESPRSTSDINISIFHLLQGSVQNLRTGNIYSIKLKTLNKDKLTQHISSTQKPLNTFQEKKISVKHVKKKSSITWRKRAYRTPLPSPEAIPASHIPFLPHFTHSRPLSWVIPATSPSAAVFPDSTTAAEPAEHP